MNTARNGTKQNNAIKTPMSTTTKRRLMKDLKRLKEQEDRTIYATPFEDDILTWCAVIIGPKDTIFEDGTFSLVLNFKESYPQHPPEVRFISKMFHPNIYANGLLCLDILKNRWSPTYDVYGVLMSIQSLLSDPNINSPAEAADLFKKDTEGYREKVRECVEMSWNDVS